MAVATHIRTVVKRNGETAPFDPERIGIAIYKAASSIGGKDKELAKELAREVVEQLNGNFPGGGSPTVEDVQDQVERTLILNGHALTAKAYILYRQHRKQVRKGEIGRQVSGKVETIPWKLLWKTLAWNAHNDCDSFDGLNRWIRSGRFGELVQGAEGEYNQQLDFAAQEVLHREGVRMVIVAGPSSSGKTTTTYKLAQRLKKAGMELVAINLDNYFRDLDLHPKDEYGDHDYETPEAMDLALINEHFEKLLKGEEVRMPVYDFHTGKQHLNQTPMRLADNQILLVDTLHGLYDDLSARVEAAAKFKLYIETFSQVRTPDGGFFRWTDVRLLRRMVRDANFRNHDPRLTLGHWHYVRRSEMKHIIPYLHTVDFTVNGSLSYELPVLKRQVWGYFKGLADYYQEHPERQDAIIRSQRVLHHLDALEAVGEEDEAAIPGDSLMREFIGGSTIRY